MKRGSVTPNLIRRRPDKANKAEIKKGTVCFPALPQLDSLREV
jgi:hypothetical protein